MSCLRCCIWAQSVFNWILGNNKSCPKTNCPGVTSNVVWTVLRIAHAAALRKGPKDHFVSSSLLFSSAKPYDWGCGYLVNHVLLNASMTVCTFLSGMAMTSNHPSTAGSIIVNARSVCVDLGVRTMYGPIKSTLTRDHGSYSASFGGKCPYFFRSFLNNWQVQHVLQNVSTWLRNFGHVRCFSLWFTWMC